MLEVLNVFQANQNEAPMRYWFLVVCCLILVGADKDDEKKELARFQGAWVAESIQIGPKKTPEESLKFFKLVVEGDVWIARTNGEKRSKIRLDPSRSPKELDLIDDFGGKERIVRQTILHKKIPSDC
jgi:uncharacterized protein (TIGR03067 family)